MYKDPFTQSECESENFFDVWTFFFDLFRLFFDLFRFHVRFCWLWTGPKTTDAIGPSASAALCKYSIAPNLMILSACDSDVDYLHGARGCHLPERRRW